MYRKMHRYDDVQNYTYMYSPFISCTEFHFALMLTKFFPEVARTTYKIHQDYITAQRNRPTQIWYLLERTPIA